APGGGTRVAVSDQTPIGSDHLKEVGSGARKEAFVGHKNIVSREICLRDFKVELASNIKYNRSRDASQCSGRDRGCEDLAILDDENVIGSAFGHVARVV